MLDVGSFKGLEADGIILVSKGQTFSYLNQRCLGSSRARQSLALVIDKQNDRFLVP